MKKTVKAYQDIDFLNSSDGRSVRILTEYLQPKSKFQKFKVMDTIVFFGSARLKSRREALKGYHKIKNSNPKQTENFAKQLREAQLHLDMSRYYEDAVELSRRLTEWSLNLETTANRFIICTGGGPGIMEAANMGAKRGKGRSVGINIALPFEQEANLFIDPDKLITFDHFFVRKVMFMKYAQGFIVLPGGFGTFDELFEAITLIQTEKTGRFPIVLVGISYWEGLIEWIRKVMLEREHNISESDLEIFKVVDTADDAVKHIDEFYSKYLLSPNF